MVETSAADPHPPYLYPDYKSTRLRAPAQPLVRVSGKYPHPVDDHDAPLDPNFLGKGQVLTDGEGRYRIVTVKPGAYPWQNHAVGWRPAHIHFSLFGNAYAQRLITQMFFPGDALLVIDPIFQSVPEGGRQLLIADLELSRSLIGVCPRPSLLGGRSHGSGTTVTGGLRGGP